LPPPASARPPSSVAAFIGFQLVGGAIAAVVIRVLYPDSSTITPSVVVPHEPDDQRQLEHGPHHAPMEA
jgi:hypothetical protein